MADSRVEAGRWAPEKAVVFAGLTGVKMAPVLEEAERYLTDHGRSVFKAKFEDYLKVRTGQADMETLARMITSSSRAAVKSVFADALNDILACAARRGADTLLLGVHLTYYSRGLIVVNPILSELLRLARRGALVYLVEDYYDAIYRIARSWVAKYESLGNQAAFHKYSLDPLTYLTWRGAEMSLVSALTQGIEGLRALLFAVKHPPEALHALLDDVVLGRCVVHVYLSHPISLFRQLRMLSDNPPPLKDIPGVELIERIADALQGFEFEVPEACSADEDCGRCKILVYKPTTIDELILERRRRAKLRLAPEGSSTSGEGDPCEKFRRCNGDSGKERDASGDSEVLDPRIDRHNRWPYRGIHADYPYENGGSLNLVSDKYVRAALNLAATSLEREICLGEGFYTSLMKDLIRAQIDARDYWYVEQANAVLAVIPVFYKILERDPCKLKVYKPHLSEGVEAEARRAHALAKRLTAVLIPVDLDELARVVCGDSKECTEKVEAVATEGQVLSEKELEGPCEDNDLESILLDVANSLLGGRERPLSRLGAVDGIAVASSENVSPVRRLFSDW